MAEGVGSSWPFKSHTGQLHPERVTWALRANKEKEVRSGLGWEELWVLGGVANIPNVGLTSGKAGT